MDLPLLSALFAAFALVLYVMLDGFDLGVGALLLAQSDGRLRDRMIDAILPTWDGNETWLIMAGVALLAAFPIAYGILIPAFYIPLIAMLLALGLRGVSFEFRAQTDGARARWDTVFALGSIVAALMQGVIVGGLVQGVAVEGEHFAGSVFDAFTPFSCLVAMSLLAGYILLGAGWLHFKSTGQIRSFSERTLRLSAPAFIGFAVLTCAMAPLVQAAIRKTWISYSWPLLSISAAFFVVFLLLMHAVGRRPDVCPFLLGAGLFALGMAGLALAVFPDVVPFKMSLWAAAASTQSHMFLLIGAAVVTPVVIGYSAFAYYVFRGKTPEQGWDE